MNYIQINSKITILFIVNYVDIAMQNEINPKDVLVWRCRESGRQCQTKDVRCKTDDEHKCCSCSKFLSDQCPIIAILCFHGNHIGRHINSCTEAS